MNPDRMGNNPSKGIEEIKQAVAEYFGLTIKELEGRSREQWIVGPRFLAFRLSLEKRHTPAAIGSAFGNRDRNTITHGSEQIDTFKLHPNVQTALTTLRKQLNIEPKL